MTSNRNLNSGEISSQLGCIECNYLTDSSDSDFVPDLETSFNDARTNIIPINDTECSSLLDEIYLIDEHIEHIYEEIARLQQHQAELRMIKRNKQSLFAPIRRLPDDVLREIFLVCRDSYLDIHNSTRSEYLPLNEAYFGISDNRITRNVLERITSVCWYWRELALSLPPLWSYIGIEISTFSAMASKSIENCLRLSGNTALHFEISKSYKTAYFSDGCIQALARSCVRWVEVKLPVDSLFDMTNYLLAFNKSFERLTSLHVVAGRWSVDTDVMVIPLGNLLPQLSHLDFNQIEDPIESFLGLPWTQITHYTSTSTKCYHLEGFCNLLENMPNLESFTFQGDQYRSPRRAIVPKLKILIIYNDNSMGVLEYLHAPQLQVLDIKGGGLPTDTNLPSLVVSFLNSSNCVLEEFRISEIGLNHEFLSEGLKYVKRLYARPPNIEIDRNGTKVLATVEVFECIPLIFNNLECFHLVIPYYMLRRYQTKVANSLYGFLLSVPSIRAFGDAQEMKDRKHCCLKSVTAEFMSDLNDVKSLRRLRGLIESEAVRQSGVDVTMLLKKSGSHWNGNYVGTRRISSSD